MGLGFGVKMGLGNHEKLVADFCFGLGSLENDLADFGLGLGTSIGFRGDLEMESGGLGVVWDDFGMGQDD